MTKIQLNIILESDVSSIISELKQMSEDELRVWAREELTKIMDGDELSIDWGAMLLGISLKSE